MLPLPLLAAPAPAAAAAAAAAAADIFAASLLLASNILIDHWPQLMADLRAGRCFSWLPADDCSSEGLGRRLPPPPADVAAAVDVVLAPSAELADELQKVRAEGLQPAWLSLRTACCFDSGLAALQLLPTRLPRPAPGV